MSKNPLNGKIKEIEKNGSLENPAITKRTEQPSKNEQAKRSHHKQADPTISSSNIPPQSDPAPEEKAGVDVTVEKQKAPEEKSGGLIGILKTAKARAEINEEPEQPEQAKRSHHKNEGTGRPRGRPSNADNRDEFTTLIFTLLTIGVSFANVPAELRPIDEELNPIAYNLGSILARHLPALGMSDDMMNIIGIAGAVGLWYQRVGPELKRIQKEREVMEPRKVKAENLNGHKPQDVIKEGPADPIGDVSPGAGDFLTKSHQGG